jgi:uncharacterized protein YccT (UPF0319 family)
MKEKFLTAVCLLISVLIMSGCSTHYVVQGFDGAKQPKDKIGLLIVPKDIQVLSINGKKMDKFLLNDIAFNYQLLPGINHIRYRYASLWAVAGVNARKDKSPSEMIESNIQTVDVNVMPGAEYRFKFKDATNREDALLLARHFNAVLVNDKNVPIAKGVEIPSESKMMATHEAQKATGTSSNLDALKQLWEKASADEKQRFLKWAIK